MNLPKTGKATAGEEGIIDRAVLLAGFDGNRRLLRKLIKLFLADYPLRLAHIKDALRATDAEALAREAHALKGAVGNFAAKNAAAAAQSIESFARAGDIRAASDALATLESELALLSEELKRIG